MADGRGPPGLEVDGIRHAFGDRVVIENVDLRVPGGEILCILGPSGCGKTTLLRIIAGLETLQRGRILVNGAVMADGAVDVAPELRSMSLLFQDFALFPHLTVLDNVIFGLTKMPHAARIARGRQVLEQVDMLRYGNSYPHVLSGGEQQRIALARARAPRPRVMLLDEPFSNLDVRLRSQLRDLVLHVLKQTSASTLIVTHDPEEAMFMGDRVAVMRDGRILQEGTPEELYNAPADSFVAGLFSEVNRIPGHVRDRHVDTLLGRIPAPGIAEGAAVEVLVRPEALEIAPATDADASPATVLTSRMLGQSSLVHLGLRGPDDEALHLHVRLLGRQRPAEDSVVGVRLHKDQVFVFPAEEP